MVITLTVLLSYSDFVLKTDFALFLCLAQRLSVSLAVGLHVPFGKECSLYTVWLVLRTCGIELLPGTPIVLVIMVPDWRAWTWYELGQVTSLLRALVALCVKCPLNENALYLVCFEELLYQLNYHLWKDLENYKSLKDDVMVNFMCWLGHKDARVNIISGCL